MKTAKKQKEKGEQASVKRKISKTPTGGKRVTRSSLRECLKNTGDLVDMKTAKTQKAKEKQASIKLNISKSPSSGGKRAITISMGQCHKNTDKQTAPATSCKMPSSIIQEEERKLHSLDKIKLQLFPLDERIREGLEKDGHNPFLELTLKPTKKIFSVFKRIQNKWGNSSIARGDLILTPFYAVLDNSMTCKKWTTNEAGIAAADVHTAIGKPDNFRLRYSWVSSQTSDPISSPSLGCPETGHLERVSCSTMEIDGEAKMNNKVNSREEEPNNGNEVTNEAVEQTILAEPDALARISQTDMKNEEFNPNKTRKLEQDAAVEGKTLASSLKFEEPRMQNELAFTSVLWSDTSSISIGGLLSEASLQGRFNTRDMKLGSGRLESQTTTVNSESLDALISGFKSPQASPNMFSSILDAENASCASESYVASSILDAENTCYSFAFSKPAFSKDFLTLGRSALSELSNQPVASRPFKCPESEASAQDGVTRNNAVHEPKTDQFPSSNGIFNNENSLGLSSIRWNDSMGPFDLPLTSRQIIKDDSISLGGYIR